MMEKIEQKALRFIEEKKLIDKGDKILVALSGGPDSVFLLHLLKKYERKFRIELGAVHINHMIRGKSANAEEEFCRELSLNLGIKFFSLRRNVKEYSRGKKISVEEGGRIIRYAEFDRTLKKFGADKLATAHNCSDNAETVLLNLIKGTGLKGISGIPVKRGYIIRPILNLKKDEILEYLNRHGIDFKTDESNLSGNYERNFLRLNIIPLIKERLNPDFENSLLNSSEIFRSFSTFLEKRMSLEPEKIFEFRSNELKINSGAFAKVEDEIKSYFLKSAVEKKFKMQLEFKDYRNILQLLDKQPGRKISLSNNLAAFKERDCIIVNRKNKTEEFKPVSLSTGEEIETGGKILSVKMSDRIPEKFLGNKLKEYISADKLNGNFVLRRWKAGDRFVPFGFKGSKKISDFLNGQKIPTSKKKEQLVLTYRGQIVWVLGLRLDDRFKITNNTKKVFELCLK